MNAKAQETDKSQRLASERFVSYYASFVSFKERSDIAVHVKESTGSCSRKFDLLLSMWRVKSQRFASEQISLWCQIEFIHLVHTILTVRRKRYAVLKQSRYELSHMEHHPHDELTHMSGSYHLYGASSWEPQNRCVSHTKQFWLVVITVRIIIKKSIKLTQMIHQYSQIISKPVKLFLDFRLFITKNLCLLELFKWIIDE